MRRCLFLFSVISCFHFTAFPQYWQQHVSYVIDVTLDDNNSSLDAFEKIEYTNNSPDTLHFIWFHVWPNAYKNDRTAFSDQLLENGNTSFYFSGKEEKGFINRLDFKVNDQTARLEDHPQYIDIIKVVLPAALLPGQTIKITTPFHEKLPYNFSRGGHDGQSYQVTQWFPKPAVYDASGWHPMPYLDQGEFYSEFGSFDVSITTPSNYVVAATGRLQNEEELHWLKTRANYEWTAIKHRVKIKGGGTKTTVQLFPESSKQTKTLRFIQDSIHDFAWFADKRFIVKEDSCQLGPGKTINVFTYYTPAYKDKWDQSLQLTKDGVRYYSNLVGEYPYTSVSVVQGPASFGGGMEYPMITVISPGQDLVDFDNTVAHEIGHNWFYGILGSNERDFPWMDEGINTYYDYQYTQRRFGYQPPLDRIQFETKAVNKTDQPINTTSAKFSATNYDQTAYYKTGAWMRYLESQVGTPVFNKGMQEYFREWQFKHPHEADFKKVIESVSGMNLDSTFGYLDKKGILPNQVRTGSRVRTLFPIKNLKPNVLDTVKNITWVSGALGFNSYDKLMIGALISNIKLPPSPLQYLVAPMYAIGSKKFAGLGLIYHTFYPNKILQKVEWGVSASTFTSDEFTDEENHKTYLGFRKIVPGFKLTFRNKDPRSTLKRYVQFKSYLVNEDELHFFRDTVITGIDTTILNRHSTTSEGRNLFQLNLVYENTRALYPWRGELRLEKGDEFYRASFTGNYFFNYGKTGGLDVRLFAGKFFYAGGKTITKQFATDRYHLDMTGPNGYEDYTYSDYFAGRNKFDGLASQQIMIRDGGFKVRTDLLAQKIGKTDDWLIATNLSTSIPNSVNPLAILPIKIPLKIFLDIGTYAEAWKENAETDRFLFDAGIELPLFNQTINIYLPIVYSDVYKNYIKSTIEKKNRFLKTISFSFDLSRLMKSKYISDL